MEVLLVFVVALLVAVPVIAVVALCLAIGARRQNEELQNAFNGLRLEVRRLRNESERSRTGPADKKTSQAEACREARTSDTPGKRGPPPIPAAQTAATEWRVETEPVERHGDVAPESGPPKAGAFAGDETFPAGATFDASVPAADPMQRLAETLRRLGCLPPADDDRVEASLGAWWATRLGILMAVIAAVFFGVYVSQDTPPWVRFTAVLLVGFGVSGAGLWLERTLGAFGRVVFAGGLGIVYFAAFAAYAVPAMRVASGPVSGGILQALAVGIILTASVWKQRESIATMAVSLGYVSCLFAFAADLETFAWAGGVVLGAGAGALLLVRGWRYPLAVAVAGAWGVVALLVLTVWLDGQAPSFGFAMASLAGQFTFFLMIERLGRYRQRGFPEQGRCLFHFFNSTAVLVLGWFFAREAFPENLAWFYLVFGVLLLLVWEVFRRGREAEILSNGYFVKGTALVALFVVTYFSGEIRWIALLVQAACLLPLLRERLRISMDVVFHGVLAAAVGLFLYELSSNAGPYDPWSVSGLMALGFVLGVGGVLTVRRRFLPDAFVENHPSELLAVVGQVAAGLVAIAYLQAFFEPLGRVGLGLAFALLFGGMDLAVSTSRRWFIAGGLAAFYAYATYLIGWPVEAGVGVTLLAGVWVAGMFFGAAVFVARVRIKNSFPSGQAEYLLHGLWLFVVVLVLSRVVVADWFLFAAMAGTCVVYLISRWTPGTALAVLSGAVYVFALGFCAGGGAFPAAAPAAWLAVLMGAGYLLATGGVLAALDPKPLPEESHQTFLEWGGGVTATAAVLIAVYQSVGATGQAAVLAVAAIAGVLAWRWRHVTPWVYLSATVMLVGHVEAYRFIARLWAVDQPVPGGAFFWVAAIPAALVVVFGLLVIRRVLWSPAALENRLWVACALAGMGISFIAAVQRGFGLVDYATIIWGMAAVALFVTGLVFRVQPFRLIALAGVGLGVFRLFAVDIQDTLNRIMAFAVLGLVLLGIGFLYHRFRHRLFDAATGREEEESG